MFRNRKTLSTLLVWLVMQFLCMLPVSLIMMPIALLAGIDDDEVRNLTVLLTLLLSQIAEMIVLRLLRYFKFKEIVFPVPEFLTLSSAVIAGICLFYATDILQAQFNIPDLLEQDMGKLTESVWGFLTICIVGPVAEEVMMRRIILRDIWQKSGKMWNGILLSALIFALIHINPAQVVFAFPAGIILGWLYCASGSLIVPVIIHIINNTISFIAIRSHSTEPSLSDPVNIAVLATCLITGFLLVWLIASISKKKDLYLKPDDKQETGLEQEPLIEQ